MRTTAIVTAAVLTAWLQGQAPVQAQTSTVSTTNRPAARAGASDLLRGRDTTGSDTNRVAQTEVNAEVMESDATWIRATGNVIIRRGTDELRADYVKFNRITQDAEARGNVVLKRAGQVLRAPEVKYNFRTREMDVEKFMAEMDPYRVMAERIRRVDANHILMYTSTVTTCTNTWPNVHYRLESDELDVVQGESLRAHGAVMFLGPVPIMYTPYWYRNLRDEFGFRLYVGASSRMGFFALSSYRYPLGDGVNGETHVDYRTKRGVAAGQDIRWKARDGSYFGDVSGYYANDQEPMDDDDSLDAPIDKDRYRLRIRDTWYVNPEDYLLVQAQYLSDTDILEDFFEDEYRESSQPDNYASFTHRGRNYTASVLARIRLNDFYEAVNRLPEVSLNFSRQQIGDSLLYYEGHSAASFLQKVYPEDSGSKDYDALRLDLPNMVYFPTRNFGFLNIIPRAGYRGTYYSATFDQEDAGFEVVTNASVRADGTTNTTVSTNAITRTVDKGGQLRNLFELGVETSFKAFMTWDAADGTPLRHVVEPYANYTFVPEPNITPDKLYQFDEVDTLTEANYVKLGVRNKLQTKRNDSAWDLIDLDLYTYYVFNTVEGQDAVDLIYWDGEITPHEQFLIDFDGDYSVSLSTLDVFNIRLSYTDPEILTTGLEYRFKNEESSLVSADTTFYLTPKWYLNAFARYENETSRLEEVGGYLQHNWDCMSLRLGSGVVPSYTRSDGSEVDDDWRVTFEFWITAFPEMTVSGRHRN